MEILAIGDIHGKNIWQQAVASISADRIIFVGDYIKASRWTFNHRIRANLKALLDFKRRNFDSVNLLIGNHDLVYLCPDLFSNSPIRRVICQRLFQLYNENQDCFEIAYEYNRFLFTHAGVSQPWFEIHRKVLESEAGSLISEKLNSLHRSRHFKILHEKGRARGGPFEHGGVTFADKSETQGRGLNGYIQIVGHTKVATPVLTKNEKGGRVIYIDCLNTANEFLHISESKVTVTTIQGNNRELSVD